MTKAEKIIIEHIGNMGGLTNPGIAGMLTPYAFSTCKHIFKKYARQYKSYPGQYFLKEDKL